MHWLSRIRRLLLLGLLLPTLALAGAEAEKVLYHLDSDDPGKQREALRMMQNHINAVKPDPLDLVVVLNGNGISLLLEQDALSRRSSTGRANADQVVTAQVDNLRGQGVRFLV